MKKAGRPESRVLAAALCWDGARCPMADLPPKARAFLRAKNAMDSLPSPAACARLFAKNEIQEIRICWVSQLQGGENVLSESFLTPDGLRIGFKLVTLRRFGDILGAVYRRRGSQIEPPAKSTRLKTPSF